MFTPNYKKTPKNNNSNNNSNNNKTNQSFTEVLTQTVYSHNRRMQDGRNWKDYTVREQKVTYSHIKISTYS